MNYKINSEQRLDYNQTYNEKESDVIKFIHQLSDFKEKIAACYGDEYLTIGDRLWSPGTEDQVLSFISRSYSEDITTIKIESLLDALNRTITSFYMKQQQRIYKLNRPVGSGIGPNGKMQVFIQDSEYYETDDQAVQILKQYEQISQDNLNILSFEVIIFGAPVRKSIGDILSRVIHFTRLSLDDIDAYIEHQTQYITTLEKYTIIPQSLDIFDQEVIQICTVVKRFDNKLGGVLCTSVPVVEMFPSRGVQHIIDTGKELFLVKNTKAFYNYNFFVTTILPQHFYHINQYNRTSLQINGSQFISENINLFTRLIIQFRNVDKREFKLIQTVKRTTMPFKFEKCSNGFGYIFKTNKYEVDCNNPDFTTEQIFSNQSNVEAQLLLSDVMFQQLNQLNTWFNGQRTIGRMSKNNISIIMSNFAFQPECWQQIQDLVHNYPDHEDFTTTKYHYNKLSCYYELNNKVIHDYFVVLLQAHENLLFTDFIVYPTSFVQYQFNFGEYNAMTYDMETLNTVTDNHIQTLFQEGILLCKLYDQPDYLYKGIKFGNLERIKSDKFRHLDYLNGIIFTMVSQPVVTFNCSTQIFSNDIMKNSQERPYFCINVYHDANTYILHDINHQKQYQIILLALCIGLVVLFSLTLL
ncbi:Hypothetical_protein [Hexamita inflata]|uniref:Hypothetical_protein n=1 Tax=Hexamita inflata TaxID=28002 RepID=A0AA86RTG2_9EUKA|nr:Hypothetical protein HINF_LOCUS65274 [Hexamita inflata]